MSEEKKHYENPKLKGSNIIAARPQRGECLNRCSECYFRGGRYYMPVEECLLPTVEEVENKIVRVNDGNDSNKEREMVILTTSQYKRKFFNTAIPKFNFPGPVVFTINRQDKANRVYLVKDPPPNLMFVRVRVSPWDLDTVQKAVDHYWKEHGIPVVFTFMRYTTPDLIPPEFLNDYIAGKVNVLNSYWGPKPEMIMRVMAEFKAGSKRMDGSKHTGCGVRLCGTLWSSMCADCSNCEYLYEACMKKLEALKETGNGKKRGRK